jgi:hypothetical protein
MVPLLESRPIHRLSTRLVAVALLAAVVAVVMPAAVALAAGPTVTKLSATSGKPGTTITITGTNFGKTRGTGTVVIAGASVPTTAVTSWSNTSVRFKVPTTATAGYLGVVASDTVSNGIWFVPAAAPKISSVTPTVTAYETTITIRGSNFGAARGAGWITCGGLPMTVIKWANTSITAKIPKGTPAGYIGVVQNTLTSNGVMVYPYYPSVVASLSAPAALVGDKVTIYGTAFGDTQGTANVVVGGKVIAADSWSDTAVTFTLPDDAISGYAGITRDGRTSNGRYLAVGARLTGADKSSVTGGDTITITGRGFGTAQGTATVTLAGQALTVTSWSATSITVTVPAGASAGYLGVVRDGVASNGLWTATY